MGFIQNIKTTYKYNGLSGVVRKIIYRLGNPYQAFLKSEQIPSLEQMQEKIKSFKTKPLISIIIPVYNPQIIELQKCVQSIQKQGYPNYEVFFVDDGSSSKNHHEYLRTLCVQNESLSVEFLSQNIGIAAATNKGIERAKGEYIAFMDQDDMLAPHALYEYVVAMQQAKYDLFYSDEDLIDRNDRRQSPQFKPDWSPHTILSRMYVNHFSMYHKSIIEKTGWLRSEFDGCQDYDFLLRALPYIKKVYHCPKILYHWRMSKGSIATNTNNKSYIFNRATRAIQESLKVQQNLDVLAKPHEDLLIYDLNIQLQMQPLVSIIIPFKNGFVLTQALVESIIQFGGYKNIEFILVDNQSTKEQRKFYDDFIEEKLKCNSWTAKIIDADFDFNYSMINNLGVQYAQGEYLLFLNNDIVFFEADTVKKMLSFMQLKAVGVAGITLLYPDERIQHAGVILGYHEVAGHYGVGAGKNEYGYYGRYVSLYNNSAETAACLLVSKAVYASVGGFEEQLHVAYNDVDFCLKIREAGYYNIHIGNIRAFHHESITRGYDTKTLARYQKECQFMEKKWSQYLKKDPFYNENLSRRVGELFQILRK